MSGKDIHAAEEYVVLESVVDCARVLTEIIMSYYSGEEAE
jgi:acetylornithine deacetylase/succinyl-diaminopimelate desuccinylase-like protein